MTYSTVVVGVFLCVVPLLERETVQAVSEGFAVRGFGIYRILSIAFRPNRVPSD